MLRAGIKEPVYEKALILEKNCEDITLYAREIPVCTGSRNAEKDVERNINAAYRCTAGYTGEGWFRLAIPALLPKKNASGNVNYIRGSLYPQLNVFFSNHPRKRFGKCVIAYIHIYDKTTPEKAWRDHDNIEINQVTDIVALFTMHDDAPKWCSHFYCSEAGEKNETQVYVIPESEFGKWLAKYRPEALCSDEKRKEDAY